MQQFSNNQDGCDVDVQNNDNGDKVQQGPVITSGATSKDVRPPPCIPPGDKRFDGFRLDEVMVLEIFAGTARLTRAVRDAGMSAMAIDKDSQRAQSVHIASYDLNEPDQLHALCDFIGKHHQLILWAHFAPSCGTASRARGKPLPKLEKMGIKVPKPLRSDSKPMGMDGLSGLDKVKTECANITYESTCVLMRVCIQFRIAVSLENPKNSLFWKVPIVEAFLLEFEGYNTVFDNCCHGGTRKKATLWWSNVDWFTSLAAQCDDSHYHQKWNAEIVDGQVVFPTHLEAAYPILLCERLAAIAKVKAVEMGATEVHDLAQQTELAPSSQHRFLLDMLPKGRKFKPLVSEYGSYQKWAVAVHTDFSEQQFLHCFPKGTKVVHRQFYRGALRVDDVNGKDSDVQVHDSCKLEHAAYEIFTMGIPREPVDFLEKAVRAGHPRSIAIHLPQAVKDVLDENFSGDEYKLTKERANFLWKWSSRAKELAEDERRLHENMPEHLQQLLSGKRLLLMKEVLEDLKYPDTSLFDEITQGFTLHGWMTESGVFPRETKRPEYTIDMVKNMAKGVNNMIYSQVVGTSDDDLSRKTWEKTLEEIDNNWVWRDVVSDVGDVVMAKRFGLQQKEKVRVIDDCSVGGYNKAYGTKEKLRVHAIDQLAAYLSWICTRHGNGLDDEVVGRTYDLRSAYKQFGVSVETRDVLRLVVWDADQKRPCLLGVNALPFGASGSVSAFLRVSMALWFIGTVGLKLCWTVFYDDFTVICKKRLCHGTSIAAEALFDLFGMWFAKDGSKATPFGTLVRTLGLQVQLGSAARGFCIGHTEERRSELKTALLDVLERGTIEPKQAERLRGRMQWFEGYAFGRVAQFSLKVLGDLALRKQKQVKLNNNELHAVRFLIQRVSEAEAVEINSVSLETFLIFTDGACEGDSTRTGSVGGVLIGPNGQCLQHFSSVVPETFMKVALDKSANPIYELELLPIYLSLLLWGNKLKSTHLVCYLDNDAARAALCKGYGSTDLAQRIVAGTMESESQLKLKSWFARVPTHSNIADGPSRMDCREVEQLGSQLKEIDWDMVLENLLESSGASSKRGEHGHSE